MKHLDPRWQGVLWYSVAALLVGVAGYYLWRYGMGYKPGIDKALAGLAAYKAGRGK